MAGELGKASLDLEANVGPFERNVASAKGSGDRLKDTLEALAAVAEAAQGALNDVSMGAGQGTKSRVTAEEIISGVRGIGEQSRDAALELDRVKLSETQANETEAAALRMDRALDGVSRNADQTRRRLESVRLAGGRNGAGVGIFGSGFGRIGLLGTAVGLGALTAPAAAPGALGLLASIPTFASAGAGALGTLALAFSGVFKAIGGDKKAFDDLTASQQKFVQTVRGLDDFLDRLKQIAGESFFPGLTKGLKAALSPGTINAIETALVQLGHALGAAGEAWGKYFGSQQFQQIFGPLMQAAARNIGVVSDTILHLFDTLGVLAKATIPFTNWLTTAIDKGAKFADAWLRAKSATGELGGAMREAQSSLRLVGGLVMSLLRVVFALGKALYPVAKIAVKDLTNGLNALAKIIQHNQGNIRDLVRGALSAFVTLVKIATPIVKGLATAVFSVARFMGGWKNVLLALVGIKFALVVAGWTKAINALIFGQAAAAGGEATGGLLGASLASAKLLTKLRALAGLGVITVEVILLEHFITKYGLKNTVHAGLNPGDSLGKDVASDQTITVNGKTYPIGTAAAYDALVKAGAKLPPIGKVTARQEILAAIKLGGSSSIPASKVPRRRPHHKGGNDPKPGTHAWYMKYLGFDPTRQPTFGKPPPFTSNTGSGPPLIPSTAAHLIALASGQASVASTTKNPKKERAALTKEIDDLQKADQILLAKWRKASGKTKTELFNTITSVQNKIRSARKKLRDAAGNAQTAKLDYALDQAKLAVEKAQEGTKAWDRAVAAEEKALKAEIAYWDKRAHNDKLAVSARDAALKKELQYQKQLKALLAPIKAAATANIAQFLSTYADIQNEFGYNAVPIQGGSPSTGSSKTDTHLHDIKNGVRQTNQHLQAIRSKTRHPATAGSQAAAMAVTG